MQAIELIGNLALAMGPHTKPNIPHLLPCVLGALGDSKPNVRAAAISTLNTFMKETSMRDMFVSDIFGTVLWKANPFVKQEVFGWMGANLMESKPIAKEELTACLGVLYASLEDRSGDVRKASQDAILGFMKHLGFQSMVKATEKLSAVSKNTVTPLLDKARGELPPPPAKKAAAAPVREAKPVSSEREREPSESRPPTAEREKKESTSKAPTKAKSRLGVSKPSSSKKKEEEMDSSPPYQANKLKNTRFRDETKLKLLKWNFATPRPEFVEQLKDQLVAASLNKSLMTMMFHADFKQHLKALEMLVGFVESDFEALIANLDLLLKWMTLRFFEIKTSVNIKGLEYLTLLFTVLSECDDGYNLHEIEATSFIPYIITKIGDPKDQIRASCKTILRLLCKFYPASKLFTFIMVGIGTKNAKQRTECLDEIGCLIYGYGTGVAGAKLSDALKEMAKHIADRDNSVRNAALNAITETYFQEGEKLYKRIGNLPEKDMAMLEERIKRASKTRHVVNHGALVEILIKIGQKDLTKVGLQELYNFKVENPHVDLEPHLTQSNQYFRDYIERGLKKIEEEVKVGSAPVQSGIPAPSSYSSVLTDNVIPAGAGGLPQHLVYLERLKRLRAAGGLGELVDQENVENYSKSGPTQATLKELRDKVDNEIMVLQTKKTDFLNAINATSATMETQAVKMIRSEVWANPKLKNSGNIFNKHAEAYAKEWRDLDDATLKKYKMKQEERVIDDLVEFIEGEVEGKNKRKKRRKSNKTRAIASSGAIEGTVHSCPPMMRMSSVVPICAPCPQFEKTSVIKKEIDVLEDGESDGGTEILEDGKIKQEVQIIEHDSRLETELELKHFKLNDLLKHKSELERAVNGEHDHFVRHKQNVEEIIDTKSAEMKNLILMIEKSEDDKSGRLKEVDKVDNEIMVLQTKKTDLLNENYRDEERIIKIKSKKHKLETFIEKELRQFKEEGNKIEDKIKDLEKHMSDIDNAIKDCSIMHNVEPVEPHRQILGFIDNQISEKEKELECPVCLEVAAAPIFMCSELHLICCNCRPKVKACPECRMTYIGKPRRHRYAEKTAEEVVRIRNQRAQMGTSST